MQRANDKRKLTNREWSVTNEICSVLDPIAEVSIKIQGAKSTYIGEAAFLMKELMEIAKESEFDIRVPHQPNVSPVQYEPVAVNELLPEVRAAVTAFLEVMETKKLGELHSAVERVSMLLDPRQSKLSLEEYVNGGDELRHKAIENIKRLGDHFVDESPVLATVPAPAPQSSGSGPVEPADILPEVPSWMQRRRKQRLFAAGASGGSGDGILAV